MAYEAVVWKAHDAFILLHFGEINQFVLIAQATYRVGLNSDLALAGHAGAFRPPFRSILDADSTPRLPQEKQIGRRV